MRLLIISHTPHYLREGRAVGWGATIREIDQLATLFESVVHIAPLHAGPAPASALPYQSPRVRFRAVPPAGGAKFRDKLLIPFRYPGYVRAILNERRQADVIHVRAPANISLITLVLLAFLRHPKLRWAKYAGDWNRAGAEPLSYRFQRWWLFRGLHRGLVTVNGRPQKSASHVRSFLNPCLMDEELQDSLAECRQKELREPIRVVFVGRLESAKGVGICLETVALLHESGTAVELDLIGGGPLRPQFEQKAKELGVWPHVRFQGELPRQALGRYYARAHFILLPSQSEGWPKVLSEAMAYGVVPLASAVGSIPEYLADFGTGRAIRNTSPAGYVKAISEYALKAGLWLDESHKALQAARQFTYARYLQAVRELLGLANIAHAS
jgi:glycosyltransferase involved in cell wall biosynthesis